jgi:hypothetical protein
MYKEKTPEIIDGSLTAKLLFPNNVIDILIRKYIKPE